MFSPAVMGHLTPSTHGVPPRPGLVLSKRLGAMGTAEGNMPVAFFSRVFQFARCGPAFELIETRKSNTDTQSLQPLGSPGVLQS